MFKTIFQTIISLGTAPIPEWRKLSHQETTNPTTFYNHFIYPLLGMTTLANFIGILYNKKGFQLEDALKSSTLLFITLFVAFFLSTYLINKLLVRFFYKEDDLSRVQYFVGYIYSFSYVIQIILALFPSLFFIKFGLVYVIYIIWAGSESFMAINEKQRSAFLITISFILFVTPLVIKKIFLLLMPRLS